MFVKSLRPGVYFKNDYVSQAETWLCHFWQVKRYLDALLGPENVN